jgi:hypothetical protein
MTAKETNREIAALSAFVTGTTLEMGAFSQGQIPGAILIDRERTGGIATIYDSLAERAEASVDAIVTRRGLETVSDPWKCLREWRRVLKPSGTIALVCADTAFGRGLAEDWRQTFTQSGLMHLLRAAGFEVERGTSFAECGSFLVVAKKTEVGRVRGALARCRPSSPRRRRRATRRARSSTSSSARSCCRRATRASRALLQDDADARAEQRGRAVRARDVLLDAAALAEAVTELQRALALDPKNQEAMRWLQLAKERVGGRTTRPTTPACACE